ncbi:MAG: hypothetical protein DRN96_06830 [Thermoproteota archaeon]|nr:MAG: hypothetical protein DRN96_06830 [Candidatus Korarchaeota archaeon]RLG52213.1 MAG: hypothetical protein DRN99_07815 [Candidatus Korarchaeota archaeon]
MKADEYYTEAERTFFTRKPPLEARGAFEAMMEARAAVLDSLQEGRALREHKQEGTQHTRGRRLGTT